MRGESIDFPLFATLVAEDPALGTAGAPANRLLSLTEQTAVSSGGSGGGTSSGLPAVYGSVLFAGPLTITSAWTTVIDAEVSTSITVLKRLFYNPSDEMIELYFGTAPGAIDHTGLELPAKPQGPAIPGAAPVVVSQSNTGGAIAANTYFYRSTSVDVNGLESAPTPSSVGVVLGGSGTAQATMAIPSAARAVKYRHYRSTTAGSELLIAETRAPIFVDVGATAAIGDGFTLASPLSTGVQPSSTANPVPWDFRSGWTAINVNADIAARHYGTGNKTLIVVELGA